MRLLAALLATAVVTVACDGGDDAAPQARPTPSPRPSASATATAEPSPDATAEPSPTATAEPSPDASAPVRPDELDVARSERVTRSVRACARDENVELDDLKVRVDDDGVLIGIGYRALGAPAGFDEIVERCLRDAGVTRPQSPG